MICTSTAEGRSRWLALCGLAALSGALLFVSDHPVHAWPLQAAALLPLFLGLERLCRSSRGAALAGVCLALLYVGPLALVLEFPLAMALPLGLYMVGIWVLICVGAQRALRWRSWWGALAAGAVAAIVEWIDFSALPIWGTAQCFARVWSASPFAIGLTAVAGVSGLVFVLVAGQALVARIVVGPARRGPALALGLLVVAALGLDAWAWLRPAQGSMKVAAMGWTAEELARRGAVSPDPLYRQLYEPYARQAARQGAKLVVSPEVGFWLRPERKGELLLRFGGLARELRVALAVGYFDVESDDNRVAIFDESGLPCAVYRKTHLIPFVEKYRAGKGELALCELEGVSPEEERTRVGAMICQDDNFTDLARGYGQRRAQLLVVPTNDWRQVKDYHLENSLFRAVENGYGVARAASNGVSAIVSPRGEVLAALDHLRDGPGVIVAEVPLRGGGTLYSFAGDWLVGLAALGLAGGLALSWRARRRAARTSSAPSNDAKS